MSIVWGSFKSAILNLSLIYEKCFKVTDFLSALLIFPMEKISWVAFLIILEFELKIL